MLCGPGCRADLLVSFWVLVLLAQHRQAEERWCG
jgi:hypothetical protein